ncbi:hypothetical protein BP6252_03445 [Coleophoma cylindrospora]|uniref:Uncharacterized protein n=1 Tax=Coleophoma cylindrospora TaxID=1849047 RepID=A0A3D8S7Q2_9HELO|nr:hypothetical protein BP6252_03445 [Coleophoma cylindrospora]
MASQNIYNDSEKRKAGVNTYRTYVKALCVRNPSLLNLDNFLTEPRAAHSDGCRVAALDFRPGIKHPITRTIVHLDNLHTELDDEASQKVWDDDKDHALQGRILIIEDLTPDLVELLGSDLEIDPLFFAMHLHTAQRNGMRQQTPEEASLPSRLLFQSYMNVSYHRAITHESMTHSGGRLLRDSALDRKLVLLPNTKIGLAQHCASIIKMKHQNGFWLGEWMPSSSLPLPVLVLHATALILVDRPISDTYWTDGRKYQESGKVHLRSQPYMGPYEDFMEPITFARNLSNALDDVREGMFRDLQYYWQRGVPPCFVSEDPSLQSLAYYLLRITAAEWTKYVSVMHNCIKQYEYQNDSLPGLEEFDTDLYELQGWRRRSLHSQRKVRAVTRQLKSWSELNPTDKSFLQPLIEDYEYICVNIEDAGHRLENMLPVVMTMVQIVDARHSFAETANISRLTVLALIFVPLSFISSLFSMNPTNAPGAPYFWVYFAVAIPVTILVFFIARPPRKDFMRACIWFKARMKEPLLSPNLQRDQHC